MISKGSWFYWLCAGLLLSACAQVATESEATETTIPVAATATEPVPVTATTTPAPFELTSPEFENDAEFPREFSCESLDERSPELTWSDPPAGTQSFALIFLDPDAGRSGWVHWVVYGLPTSYGGLHEGFLDGEETVDAGVEVGINSSDLSIYRGPCPPVGSTHTYVFTLYALDSVLDLPSRLTRDELLTAMEGHILAEIELKATFSR